MQSAYAELPFDFDRNPGQLPKTVVPSRYRIDLVVDMAQLRFTGHERIAVTARNAGRTITLNQAGLELGSARLDGHAASIVQDNAAETATLTFPRAIANGRHTLVIDYTGPVISTPNGIYYNDYRNAQGAPKRMLLTQLETTDARRLFPGWDEPAFKATFQLDVTLPDEYTLVSNTPLTSTRRAGISAKHLSFGITPRMSSYLLALVAADQAAIHGASDGTAISVYAPTGTQASGEYALGVATELLPYFNAYFGIRYPLPKLDLLAIPGNFEAGAMENWGAITFVDNALLFDAKTSSQKTKENIYGSVAHEMAHQWSGDLVTMGWWDNIWLNEGFASWMGTKAMDRFNPAWQVWARAHHDREEAMEQDARRSTHPVQLVVHDASEADAAFDSISYQKGQQIIRMIEDWLRPDVFRAGMRTYMRAHAYGNATSADLWAALSAASHQDVTAIATSFTQQPGIPLVQVARSCIDGSTLLTLRQGRFAINDPDASPQTWTIPVIVGGPGVAEQRTTLGKDAVTLRFSGCDQALKANLGESGYYRVQYDPASLKLLAARFSQFGDADRANILGDQFALFEAGRAPLSDYLDLVAALPAQGEKSIAVWDETVRHLHRLDTLLRDSPSRDAFRAFARVVLNAPMARLGWTPRAGEPFLHALLRPQLFAALGDFQDRDVTTEAQRRFDRLLDHPDSLAPSMLDPVTHIVGMHADAGMYANLMRLGSNAADSEQKLRFFNALAASPDAELMPQTMQLVTSGAIPDGRIRRFVERMASDSDRPDAVWRLVRANQDALQKHLAPASRISVLADVAAQSADPAVAGELVAEPLSIASAGARIKTDKAVDSIHINAEIRSRLIPDMRDWLASHEASDTPR